MSRQIFLLLIVCVLIGVGVFVFDRHVTGQEATQPISTDNNTENTEKNAEQPPTKITIPNYNYASFEGTRAAALNVGLLLCQNQVDAAFAILKQSSLVNEAQMTQMKDKIKVEYATLINKQYGGSQGPEIIDEQRKGEHLYRVQMIDRRQLTPIFWELIYYKTQGQWRLRSITYHADIQKAFD